MRIYTPAAKKRSRKPTLDEQDASRRAHMIYYDFWPEDKEKPMIVTRGGSLVLRPDDQEGYDAYIEVEDGPPIELNLEIYYPRGEYAKAMDKPRLKIEDSERVRGALVPTWHEKPLLGKEMDPNKPCYTQSAVYRNYEMMEWWSHIVPIRWSEYEELTSGCFSIPKARCIGHPGEVQGHVS